MKKLADRLTGAAVLAFMAVMLLLTLFHRKETYSESEGRELAKFPGISALQEGSFTEGLTTYAADHFVGRSGWTAMKARLDHAVCESISEGVYIDESRLLDTRISQAGDMSGAAEAVNGFSDSFDGAVCFALIPTSSGVYSDVLPQYLMSVTEKQQIDGFYGLLSSDIRKIDAYNILKMLSDNYIYYRTDPRWTSYGAYAVYRTVIQKLGFQPSKYDKYTIEHITDSFKGSLFRRSQYMLCKPDIIDIYDYSGGAEVTDCLSIDRDGTASPAKMYDLSALESADMYQVYLGKAVPFLRIETSVNNERRLLVIKGDLADCFVPFLVQHYSRIDVISPELLEGALTDYIDPNDYEQALLIFGIDSLDRSDVFNKLSLVKEN
ncbi:MAG: hypothetical protein IJ071_06375 [Ruminococcus sp.]|nr:hypothetical protein [Ruminococcus sp.]